MNNVKLLHIKCCFLKLMVKQIMNAPPWYSGLQTGHQVKLQHIYRSVPTYGSLKHTSYKP